MAQAMPLRVYFGCYSQLAGHGGTGMVEINTLASKEVVKTTHEVTSDGRKVYTSALFYVDTLCESCTGPSCITDHTIDYRSKTVLNSVASTSTTLRWNDGGPVDGALTGSAWTMAATFMTLLSLLANTLFVVLLTV